MHSAPLLTGIWSILAAAVSMAFKDCTGTLTVVFESRNRGHLAGVADAGYDLGTVLITYFGAGEIIVHGVTVHALVVLATICAVSYVGTRFWTGWAHRYTGRTHHG